MGKKLSDMDEEELVNAIDRYKRMIAEAEYKIKLKAFEQNKKNIYALVWSDYYEPVIKMIVDLETSYDGNSFNIVAVCADGTKYPKFRRLTKQELETLF